MIKVECYPVGELSANMFLVLDDEQGLCFIFCHLFKTSDITAYLLKFTKIYLLTDCYMIVI